VARTARLLPFVGVRAQGVAASPRPAHHSASVKLMSSLRQAICPVFVPCGAGNAGPNRTTTEHKPYSGRTNAEHSPDDAAPAFPAPWRAASSGVLETVFAASYTKAVLKYGLTGSLARCWRRFDGDAYALPFMFHYRGFGPGCRGLTVKVRCLLLPSVVNGKFLLPGTSCL